MKCEKCNYEFIQDRERLIEPDVGWHPEAGEYLCSDCSEQFDRENTFDLDRGVTDLEFDQIDYNDAPDFVDAYISAAVWKDTGKKLSEAHLEQLNDNGQFVYDSLMDYLH
jgi:DNA-directed RNA polymerase subunit RPC12/RpoP